MFRQFSSAWCVYVLAFWTSNLALADEPLLPPGDLSPVLRLETGGPRSYTSGLAFSPDGGALYAVGWDKAVQIWNRKPDGQYEYSQSATLRVPTGSGLYGGLNSLTLSTDGAWLAVAGQGHCREMSGERNVGWVLPAGVMGNTSQFDEGLIYVFNTATREARLLRGHRGPVQSLAFVTGSQSNPPELVSVAEERTEDSNELHPHIRYWDTQKSTEAAHLRLTPGPDGKSWTSLPNLQGWRPGISAWKTGANVKQTRVAIAWGDDQFRVWDTQSGQVAHAKSNPNILTILKLPGADEKLLTGSHAEIGVWTVPKREAGQLAQITRDQYQPGQIESLRSQNLPSAAVLVTDGKNPQPWAIFVVTRYLSADQAEYRLVITTTTSPIRVVREITLPWRGDIRIPALAVTNNGKVLAISGNDDNSIALYRVEDLVAGREKSLQLLRSQGSNTRFAMFAKNGDRWGVAFAEESAGNSQKIPPDANVLDIDERRVETWSPSWQLATTTAEGWSAEEGKSGALLIHRPQQSDLTLPMEDHPSVTCSAFCPATKFCSVPLIAVGAHQRGQPLLRLYRGDTGEMIRWCVGHTERLRSLAFSEDGRMLVSSAADRTIAIWTVADLADRTLDKHGRLRAVSAYLVEGRLLIAEAPAGSPLQRGDELISMDRRGEAIPLASVRDLYQAALDSHPGTKLSLNIRRGGALQTVQCDISQAVDETKPLFSIFVAKDIRNGGWDWIGWNHLGNFDTSGDEVERLLGWQFNTGEAAHPAKFAAIGDYRDGFHRRDLLKSLVQDQKLVLKTSDEEPRISFWLREAEGLPFNTDYEDRPLVTSPKAQAVAKIEGISDRRVRRLSVSLNDSAALQLSQDSQREWTADLSTLPWKRGVHRVVVRLETFDRQVVSEKDVVFRPAAPSIDWNPSWNLETPEETMLVKADILPAREPVQVEIRILKPGQTESTLAKRFESQDRVQIQERIPIDPGENQIEIVAFNSSAPEESRMLETVKAATIVRRSLPATAPRIHLLGVSVTPDSGAVEELSTEMTEFQTQWPRVRLRGRIEGNRELESATIQVEGRQIALSGFKPGQSREFSFDEAITLIPGRQSLQILASIGDLKDEKRLTMVHEPPLPNVVSLTAISAMKRELPKLARVEPNVCYAGYHEPAVVLTAILNGHLDQPYRATFKANDQILAADKIQLERLGPNEHRLTAIAPLVGGKNRFSIGIENDWNHESRGQSAEIDFRRPPEILDVQANLDEQSESKSEALRFRVRSSLPLRSAAVVIDDMDIRRDFAIAAVKDQSDEWLVTADQFGVSEGVHTLRISATNDDGTSLVPSIHQVKREKKPTPPPSIAIHSPVASDLSTEISLTTSVNQLRLDYSVDSKTSATVRLQVQGNSAKFEFLEKVIPAEKVAIDKSVATEMVELFEGVNEIRLIADNDGGSGKKQVLKVAYVPPTATVEIISVGDHRPKLRNDGSGYFDRPAAKSRTTLRGQVRIPKDKTTGEFGARIWVNQFKLPTIPVVVDLKEPLVGRFEAEVIFNKDKANEIKVEVFRAEGRVASELGSTNTLVIDCALPEREQELYVLLLGSGDGTEMRERARNALLKPLGAKPVTKQQGPQEVWESPSFNHIHVHDALNAPPATVQHRLRELVGKMLRNIKGSKSGPQSIVMVYYQGQITMTADDFAFGAVDAESSFSRAITGRILEENLARGYGAHLIFLDLQQGSLQLQDRDIWPKAPHLGIAIQNWKGKDGQPEDTRLSSILEKTFPRTQFVRDLAEKMNEQYAVVLKQYRDKMESMEQLGNLYELRIGTLD